MKQQIVEAMIKHAEGHIEKHRMNVEKELNIIAMYEDQIEALNKYFKE